MKNVLIADDHCMIRSGIKNVLRKNFSTNRIDEAADGIEIEHFMKRYKYDLLILDINMPKTDFIRTLEWVRVASIETNVLVFSMHEEEIYGVRCLNMGAKGFLNKNCSDEELIQAIRITIVGRKYISAGLAEKLIKPKETESYANPFHTLSSRELEIAQFLNSGVPLPEICSILNIQYSTGNTYKRRILEKLNVHNVLSMTRLMTSFNFV